MAKNEQNPSDIVPLMIFALTHSIELKMVFTFVLFLFQLRVLQVLREPLV